jgi:hypothetical protein
MIVTTVINEIQQQLLNTNHFKNINSILGFLHGESTVSVDRSLIVESLSIYDCETGRLAATLWVIDQAVPFEVFDRGNRCAGSHQYFFFASF